jgi:hypothetical protein
MRTRASFATSNRSGYRAATASAALSLPLRYNSLGRQRIDVATCCTCMVASSEYLVGLDQNGFWNREPQLACGPEVDDQPELSWLFDWKISRLRAPQNLVHMLGRTTECVD